MSLAIDFLSTNKKKSPMYTEIGCSVYMFKLFSSDMVVKIHWMKLFVKGEIYAESFITYYRFGQCD